MLSKISKQNLINTQANITRKTQEHDFAIFLDCTHHQRVSVEVKKTDQNQNRA